MALYEVRVGYDVVDGNQTREEFNDFVVRSNPESGAERKMARVLKKHPEWIDDSPLNVCFTAQRLDFVPDCEVIG